ncbi:hypothetical protein chiPu_0022040 [Chiloscyllium punctatum]|uniref:Uncharacterized protein n=1 Tax=Chiloscyllium punctatum TaxID=137246 RepID=A0A401RI62_CHIPU|nr:hypothetical protein [Chiloscyllium punctatum]
MLFLVFELICCYALLNPPPQVSFQHETYPAPATVPEKGPTEPELEEQPISRQVFIVQELEIRDRLATSQINKFLYLYTSEKMPRRAHSNMVRTSATRFDAVRFPSVLCWSLTVKALHMRPESGLGGPECCLRVSLMPLRLNIDQDALFFLKDFFTSFATGINPVIPVETATEGDILSAWELPVKRFCVVSSGICSGLSLPLLVVSYP